MLQARVRERKARSTLAPRSSPTPVPSGIPVTGSTAIGPDRVIGCYRKGNKVSKTPGRRKVKSQLSLGHSSWLECAFRQ